MEMIQEKAHPKPCLHNSFLQHLEFLQIILCREAMTMKLICSSLLAVALLGFLAEAQQPQQQQPLQQTQQTQQTQPPQQTQQTQQTQPPQQTQQPQKRQDSKNQAPVQQYKPQQPKQFDTCEVKKNFRIKCGVTVKSASECESINCCFDGGLCYYGKKVTLQCTKDTQFIVVVARDATRPNIDLETISFYSNDENCKPLATTSAFAIYQFPVKACGTVRTGESGVIIYENKMSSSFEVAAGPLGAITRDSHYELLVQCRYSSTSVEALVIEVGLVPPPPPPVAAPGPLRVELRLANGQCLTKGCVEEEVAYSSFYVDADYPVTKELGDPVYVEVRMLERTDPNIVLNLGRCWATADPYPHSLLQWDLLIDGCPYRDDRYQTTLSPVDASSGLLYPTHHKRFIFKMLTFVATEPSDPGKGGDADPEVMTPRKTKMYIHCGAEVCQPSPGNNCEPKCFKKRGDVASVKNAVKPEATVVSSQQVIFVDQ